jgi:hypothetical protein
MFWLLWLVPLWAGASVTVALLLGRVVAARDRQVCRPPTAAASALTGRRTGRRRRTRTVVPLPDGERLGDERTARAAAHHAGEPTARAGPVAEGRAGGVRAHVRGQVGHASCGTGRVLFSAHGRSWAHRGGTPWRRNAWALDCSRRQSPRDDR